jgi:hypothetical protein
MIKAFGTPLPCFFNGRDQGISDPHSWKVFGVEVLEKHSALVIGLAGVVGFFCFACTGYGGIWRLESCNFSIQHCPPPSSPYKVVYSFVFKNIPLKTTCNDASLRIRPLDVERLEAHKRPLF